MLKKSCNRLFLREGVCRSLTRKYPLLVSLWNWMKYYLVYNSLITNRTEFRCVQNQKEKHQQDHIPSSNWKGSEDIYCVYCWVCVQYIYVCVYIYIYNTHTIYICIYIVYIQGKLWRRVNKDEQRAANIYPFIYIHPIYLYINTYEKNIYVYYTQYIHIYKYDVYLYTHAYK